MPPYVAHVPTATTAARLVVLAVAALGLHRLGVHVDAATLAVVAGLAEGLEQPGADPLAGHLDQTQRGDLGHLVPGPVAPEALDEAPQDQLAALGLRAGDLRDVGRHPPILPRCCPRTHSAVSNLCPFRRPGNGQKRPANAARYVLP